MGSESKAILRFNAVWIGYLHTLFALAAFLSALLVGCYLHYNKIVQNGYYGYPDEWFPSVSATIGDRYPERSLFQVLIALTAGPRFLLLALCYIRLYKEGSAYNLIGLISGVMRTFTCGGWVYITSTDDHDLHDIFMISYIVLTIPWTLAITKLSDAGSKVKRYRKYTSLTFFAALVPLIYLFIQHKVHRVLGAYSYYAYVEWSLIFLDVGFDAWTIVDFKDLTIELSSTKNGSMFFEALNNKSTKTPASIKEELKLEKPTNQYQISYFQFVVNVINSYMLWSIVTSMFLCIWHFPLWNMGISGYEAVILTLMSPVILTISPIRRLFLKVPSAPRVLAVVLAVGSYKIHDPASRLLSISLGSFLVIASFASEVLYISQSSRVGHLSLRFYTAAFLMGLILSSISKFLFWTNNPIWPIMHLENGGYNMSGLIVGIATAIFTPKPTSDLVSPLNQKPKNSLFFASCGVGGLMFSLSAMLTDSSTIILWVWDGYPVRGPMPVPHGAVTLTAMAVGVYFGLRKFELCSSWRFFSMGSLGALLLYSFHGWIGYVGGIMYTIFLVGITPVILVSLSQFYPGLVFFLGFLWDMLFVLAHVWVVAYAFVPGGFVLRERTDIVLGSSLLFIGLGLRSFRQIGEVEHEVGVKESDGERFLVKFQDVSKKTLRLLTVLVTLSWVISFSRLNIADRVPYHPESKLITLGIWTIHFGLDNDMWASEYRMRDLIKDAELDIIGLLESDTQRLIMGNRDLTQHLAEDLGMYADYGPGPNKHTWGCALLSKFPILNSTHHLLPSPVGELAPLIHATLDVYGELVDVVVFHSGQEEDVEDRRLQSLGVADIMGSSDRPMILLSYLVITPLEGNYNTYVSEKSGMHDIDPSDWDRWCEYILFKKLKRTGYARISRSSITDTELQVGKFVVPDSKLEEESLYANTRIEESEVPEDMRFPNKFYGDGVRDHRFHVFDEPRYFG